MDQTTANRSLTSEIHVPRPRSLGATAPRVEHQRPLTRGDREHPLRDNLSQSGSAVDPPRAVLRPLPIDVIDREGPPLDLDKRSVNATL